MKSKVIFLSGYLCSGKTTYYRNNYKGYTRLGVSDIVREITGKSTRKELQDTAELDVAIAKKIVDILAEFPNTNFVIDGIRQLTIFTYIAISLASLGTHVFENVWLDVSLEECERRFLAKNDGKENISFKEAFENDKKLGLLELERYWKDNHVTIVKN